MRTATRSRADRLPPREVAELTGLSFQNVYDCTQGGELGPSTSGQKSLVISRAALAYFVGEDALGDLGTDCRGALSESHRDGIQISSTCTNHAAPAGRRRNRMLSPAGIVSSQTRLCICSGRGQVERYELSLPAAGPPSNHPDPHRVDGQPRDAGYDPTDKDAERQLGGVQDRAGQSMVINHLHRSTALKTVTVLWLSPEVQSKPTTAVAPGCPSPCSVLVIEGRQNGRGLCQIGTPSPSMAGRMASVSTPT